MACEEKKNVKEVAAHFKCEKTQIYSVIKEKDTIFEKYLSSSKTDFSRKREKNSKPSDLNHIVFDSESKELPTSGLLLQEKVKELAEILKIDCFSV
ncbi:hypothetical protein J437_LFUL011284 [Ladona fulva]|uniref:Uncharacterized protein n=1 Tax=Ladona fulva TaxID=123851 RepID=A0A8K0KP89_LADFU|nr:hypothetical protein J437_LFUL011284 [Ladona fulva]